MRSAVALALLGACTFSDGEPFATIDASLSITAPIADDRALPDPGWQKLASEYQVRLSAVELEAPAVELIDLGAGGVGFDPANPPDGYSLCHNGHCHADDGRLVDYEDIAAELAGSGGSQTVAVSMPVGAVNALAGEQRALDCVPGCDLGAPAEIGLVRLSVDRLAIAGTARDGLEPPRIDGEIDFSVELGPESFAWLTSVELPIDRDADPDVELTVALELVSRYLDQIDFAGDPTAQQQELVAGLGEIELAVEIRR